MASLTPLVDRMIKVAEQVRASGGRITCWKFPRSTILQLKRETMVDRIHWVLGAKIICTGYDDLDGA